MPLTGSFRALPTRIAELCMSFPNATDRSRVAFVAWSKMSLPLPVSLRISVNVEQHVLAGLDDLVVDAALLQQRVGEGVDVFGGHVRGPAGRFEDGVGLRRHLLRFGELADRGTDAAGETGEPDRATGETGDLAEAAEGLAARPSGLLHVALETSSPTWSFS